MGKHSVHLKVLTNMMEDFIKEDPDLTVEEAAELSVQTKNSRHFERGYSAN